MTDTAAYGHANIGVVNWAATALSTTHSQTLLASEASTTATVTVTLPASALGLIVLSHGFSPGLISAIGNVSSAGYQVFPLVGPNSGGSAQQWWVPILGGVVDTQITITWPGRAPGTPWYVLADNMARVMADGNSAVGELFTIAPQSGILVGGVNEVNGDLISLALNETGNILLEAATGTFHDGPRNLVASIADLFGPTSGNIKSLGVSINCTAVTTAATFSITDTGSGGSAIWTRNINAAVQSDITVPLGDGGYLLKGQLELTSAAGFAGSGTISTYGTFAAQ